MAGLGGGDKAKGGKRIMLKGFVSAFSVDLALHINAGIEITINIEEPELKEELDEYLELLETYGSMPRLAEIPLLGIHIIKKEEKE